MGNNRDTEDSNHGTTRHQLTENHAELSVPALRSGHLTCHHPPKNKECQSSPFTTRSSQRHLSNLRLRDKGQQGITSNHSIDLLT